MSIWKSQTNVFLCVGLMLLLPDELGPLKKSEELGSTVCCHKTGNWLAPSKDDSSQRWVQDALSEHGQVVGRPRGSGIAG